MIERLLVLLAVAALVAVAALLVSKRTERRVNAALASAVPDDLVQRLPVHEPAIVYFHGSHCGACREQAAVLDALSNDGKIAVIAVDAAREAVVSRAFGVMTVPATVLIDSSRRVRVVNLGFRPRAALAAQVSELAPAV